MTFRRGRPPQEAARPRWNVRGDIAAFPQAREEVARVHLECQEGRGSRFNHEKKILLDVL